LRHSSQLIAKPFGMLIGAFPLAVPRTRLKVVCQTFRR
jgi:hypothetical protein